MFQFRNLQQKLGFYSFLVSLLAMTTVSFLTYQVARSQVRSGREQLMEMEARQIAEDLEGELRNAAKDRVQLKVGLNSDRLWRSAHERCEGDMQR